MCPDWAGIEPATEVQGDALTTGKTGYGGVIFKVMTIDDLKITGLLIL